MSNKSWLPKNIYGTNNELLIEIGTSIIEIDNRLLYTCYPKEYLYNNIEIILSNINNQDINLSKIIKEAKEIVDLVMKNPIIYQKLNKLKIHDEYTYYHSMQVAYLAVIMGIKFEFSTRELINLSIAALLHDLGKILIQKEILNKPSKLTESETKIMRQHPRIGYYLLKKCLGIDEDVLTMILCHHENYDGTGYPQGLSKDQISIQSSIIHICDVFSALVSERSYKKKYSVFESMEIIKENSGTMFDPKVVELFSKIIQLYLIGSRSILDQIKIDIFELELLKTNTGKCYQKKCI